MSADDDRDEWKRQLNTLWRAATTGATTLRDVVVRSADEGRLRIDLAVYERERRDLLEEIGRAVVQLADAGRLELPESLANTLLRLRQVESRITQDSTSLHDNAFGAPRDMGPEVGSGYDEEDPDDERK